MSQLNTIYSNLVSQITSNRLVLTNTLLGVPSVGAFLDTLPSRNLVVKVSDKNQALILSGATSPQTLTIIGELDNIWDAPGLGTQVITARSINLKITQLQLNAPFETDLSLIIQLNISNRIVSLKGILNTGTSIQYTLLDTPVLNLPLKELSHFVTGGTLEGLNIFELNLFKNVALSQFDLTLDYAAEVPVAIMTDFIVEHDTWHLAGDLEAKEIGFNLWSKFRTNESREVIASYNGGKIRGKVLVGSAFNFEMDLSPGEDHAIRISPDAKELPSIIDIFKLFRDNSLASEFSNGLSIIGLDNIKLAAVEIGFRLTTPKFNYIALLGEVSFANKIVDVSIYLPDLSLSVKLGINQTISLKELLHRYFPSAPAAFNLEIDDFVISANLKAKSYELSINSTENWEFPITSNTKFIFEQFSFDIIKNGDDLSGSISTVMKISSVQIFISGQSPDSPDAGWQFEGKTEDGQEIEIGKFVGDLTKQFGFEGTLPSALNGLIVENIQVRFNTQTKDFTFSLETKFPIDKKELDAVIEIEITHNNAKYTRKFSGIVKVGDLEFDLIFNQEQDADTIFLAAFENKSGKDETIRPLVELITDNTDILNAANGITFNLKAALLVIDKSPTATKILFGLDIGGGLNLSNLPLVGKMLPENATVCMTFQPLLTNQDFLASDPNTPLDKIRTLVPTGGFQLPKEAKKGLGFNMQLMVGQQKYDLSLPIDINKVKTQPATTSIPATTTASNVTTTATPPATTANIKWFVIQRQLGPVSFGRIGVQFQDSQLYFLLDASLSLAGLTISLDGLFVSSTLNPIHPKFGLHGLGIDYKKGALEIGGAFLRQTITDKAGNTYDTYDGTAVIRTEKFALAAMGSYAYYQGHPSLFIYAFLSVPLGGPAFFFVTGLAAGFGYNRRVVVPALDGVKTFPLVAQAMSGPPDTTKGLSGVINQLHEVIPPAIGEYFLAVGIRFSSFKIIDSFVLLTVSFGQEFEVDVLGISTLVIPTPDAGSNMEPLAEVQLALRAVFNPDKGYLKIQAELTAASFILSRNCHLTGGFAFFVWFKDSDGASAGDFVLTLGGYHPRFKPPAHYPRVASLGFNWQVIPELMIKGDFYFALVPSAVMAGGHLSATWTSGNLKAWFNIGADFIISWKPYFYDASMYLDMGVSYTFELFGTHHITVDVGADLHIWGPEFSGKAHVHLWIVTFDVSFGANSKLEPPALNWGEFRKGFLPDNSKWESVSVTKGLVKQLGTEADPLFVINPKDFRMETTSAIPITASNRGVGDSNTNIHIGSMKITNNITSTHDIVIKLGTNDVTSDFTFTPVKKHVPGALWGSIFKHSENETEDQRLVKNACMGFSIQGKPITASQETHDVASEKLLNDEELFENGKPIAFGAPISLNGKWLKSKDVRNSITQNIEAKITERNNLLKALNILESYHPNKELADEFILTAI